jgi:hypothetical protein
MIPFLGLSTSRPAPYKVPVGKPLRKGWPIRKTHGYETSHEVIHDLMLAQNTKMPIFVMPAWMAGTQVRKDASGDDIPVDLDSSTPCWNDESRGSA